MTSYADKLDKVARLSALAVVTLGATVIFGWHTGNVSLIQILPHFVPMQYNTALCFVLCGAAFLLCIKKKTVASRALSLLVMVTGGLTQIEYLSGVDLGIDQLLMRHYITVQSPNPGRMAPNTALCFILASGTLLLATRPMADKTSSLPAGILGSSMLGLATIAFFGYVFDIQPAYAWGKFTRMALHTSLGFIVLACGLIAHELSTVRDWNRHWWPVSVSIAFITISIALTVALDKDLEQKQIITASSQFNPMSLIILLFGAAMGIIIYVVLRMMQNANLRVAELHHLSDQLTRLSRTDHLTQLHNRLSTDTALAEEVARANRFGRELSVILIDIDHFKKINDSCGHQIGDEVIARVADLLRRRSRSIDVVGRYGGEEFIILCPETGCEGAVSLAESLRRDMEKTGFAAAGAQTFSVGVATLQTNDTARALVNRADTALYQAKADGRNRVVALP